MTPERQKWWDSLPKEEKRVRQDIKRLMDDIYYSKESLQLEKLQAPKKKLDFKNLIVSCQLQRIKEHKRLIKALRKQIAMRPITKRANGDDYRKCPHCGRYLWRIEDDIYYDYPPKYCEDCGQKLRWA